MPLPHLSGFSSNVPLLRVSNADLVGKVDTTDEWIVSRTGIKARRVLDDAMTGTDLAMPAAFEALALAGYRPDDVTHLIVATCTPDCLCPSSACLLAGKMGLGSITAYDLGAACSGFIFSIDSLRGLFHVQPEAVVLLVCVEAVTRRLNWADRGTCVLFGDGAGACVLTAARPPAPRNDDVTLLLDDTLCASDGRHAELIRIGGGSTRAYQVGDPVDESFFLTMQGREVFKHAVRSMTRASEDILAKNGLTLDDVDLFIPHQANMRIIEAVGERLGLSGARVFTNVEEYGNTSAASIPLALAEARREGLLQPGMRLLLSTFGSGFTWGSALLRVAPQAS